MRDFSGVFSIGLRPADTFARQNSVGLRNRVCCSGLRNSASVVWNRCQPIQPHFGARIRLLSTRKKSAQVRWVAGSICRSPRDRTDSSGTERSIEDQNERGQRSRNSAPMPLLGRCLAYRAQRELGSTPPALDAPLPFLGAPTAFGKVTTRIKSYDWREPTGVARLVSSPRFCL